MHVEVRDPEVLPGVVAATIAAMLREAVAARGVATLAVSGGRTPSAMLAALAAEDVPWTKVWLLQVDERVAPAGDPARNLVGLQDALVRHGPVPAGRILAMPVDGTSTSEEAARRYAATLRDVAGRPPVLDIVQLGLGDDGHTASLVPDDPASEVTDADVAATETYRGHRRVTLTRPTLDRARHRVWLVTGADKAGAVARLWAADPTIPGGRIRREHALLLLDPAAARFLAADAADGRG
ncbi:6-phosphogluconolactonase [Egicoccus sp. AB-alg2]|uniref:6-phosphogluconolactonase n=1 Tax=Egicoccus sp. AB-alg2 TaxID=3242693 RepID=UPI00359DE3A1